MASSGQDSGIEGDAHDLDVAEEVLVQDSGTRDSSAQRGSEELSVLYGGAGVDMYLLPEGSSKPCISELNAINSDDISVANEVVLATDQVSQCDVPSSCEADYNDQPDAVVVIVEEDFNLENEEDIVNVVNLVNNNVVFSDTAPGKCRIDQGQADLVRSLIDTEIIDKAGPGKDTDKNTALCINEKEDSGTAQEHTALKVDHKSRLATLDSPGDDTTGKMKDEGGGANQCVIKTSKSSKKSNKSANAECKSPGKATARPLNKTKKKRSGKDTEKEKEKESTTSKQAYMLSDRTPGRDADPNDLTIKKSDSSEETIKGPTTRGETSVDKQKETWRSEDGDSLLGEGQEIGVESSKGIEVRTREKGEEGNRFKAVVKDVPHTTRKEIVIQGKTTSDRVASSAIRDQVRIQFLFSPPLNSEREYVIYSELDSVL